MKDKRKYPRVGISFPLECKLLPQRNYFYTVSKDLSLGGVKILTDKFIAKGISLKVNLNLIDKVVALKAKVAWCNKERVAERYSAGLEIVEINEENKKELSFLVNKIHCS